MKTINRNLLIVKPKQPYVDWINAQPDQDTPVTLADIHRDCHTYLIPEVIGEEDAYEYIEAFKPELFIIELNAWYRDPKIWPETRTSAIFDEWFELEFHSMIFDMGRKRIRKR